MKINEIFNESGEPKNPSRRGFLKTLGAAGVAAAMPGTAMKALAEPAAAAEVPAAASAVAPAAVEANLLSDLTNYVWNSGISIPVQELMSDKDLENYQDELEDEGEIIWNPDIDLSEPSKNGGGYTPWGEFYTFQTSPGGVPYIFTGAGYEHPYTAYVAYRDPKTGEIVTDSIYYDSTSHNYNWEDFDLEWEDESETGEMIDRVIAGEYGEESRDSYWHDEITKGPDTAPAPAEPTKAADTTPADIARLAGLAKQGYDKASDLAKDEPKAAAPQALPAPQKPDIDLTPDLKQKQQEPVKRNKDNEDNDQ